MILNVDERRGYYGIVYVDDAGEEHDVRMYYDDDQRYWVDNLDIKVEVPADTARELLAKIDWSKLRQRLAVLDVGLYGEAP